MIGAMFFALPGVITRASILLIEESLNNLLRRRGQFLHRSVDDIHTHMPVSVCLRYKTGIDLIVKISNLLRDTEPHSDGRPENDKARAERFGA